MSELIVVEGVSKRFRLNTSKVNSIKERALARTAEPGTRPRRYRASDSLLALLARL